MGFLTFMKTSKHKRFVYEPRYFDPVAEELRSRTEDIRREVEARHRQSEANTSLHHAARISRGFARSRASQRKTSFLQVFIILVICVFLVAYFKFGNWGLLVPLAAVPAYVLARRYNLFEV